MAELPTPPLSALQISAHASASSCKSSSSENFVWREIKSIFDATSVMEHYLKPVIHMEDLQWTDNNLLVRLRQLLVLDRLLLENEHNNSRTLIALTDLLECHQILPCLVNNRNHVLRSRRQQQWWDIRLDGQSTLVYCIKEGLFDVVRLLLDRGANPNLCGKFFHTPLKAAFIQIEQTAKDFNDMQQFIERGGRGGGISPSDGSVSPNNFQAFDDEFALIAPAHDAMVKERMRCMCKKLHELEKVVRDLIHAGAEVNYVHVIDYKRSFSDGEAAAEHVAAAEAVAYRVASRGHETAGAAIRDPVVDRIPAENFIRQIPVRFDGSADETSRTVRVILPTSYLTLAVQSCSRQLIHTLLRAGAELQPKHQPHFVHPFYTALKRGRWSVAYEMLRYHGLDPTIYDQSVVIVILQRVWSKSRSSCMTARWRDNMIPLYAFLCYYTLELADYFTQTTRELLRKDLLDYFIKNFIGPQTFDTEGSNLLVYRSVPSLKWLARKAVNSKVLPKVSGYAEKPFAREFLCRHRHECLRRLQAHANDATKSKSAGVSHALIDYLHYAEYNAIFMLPNLR